jgi:hypothetical protein
MNTNCVVGYLSGSGRSQLVSQTLAGTTETEFKIATDSGTNAIAVLTVPQPTAVIGSGNPLSTETNPALLAMGGRLGLRYMYAGRPGFTTASFDKGRPFLVRICGVATPASNAGNTLTVTLYKGTSKAGTAIATTGAITQNAVTNPVAFILEAQLTYNSAYTTGNLNGQFWYFGDGSTPKYNTWAVTTTANVATLATLQFCASWTWGNGVGGEIQASEFSLSQL